MRQFEYKLTKYPSETFKELVYYCSEAGDCTLEQVPQDQSEALQNILNSEGENGWELIQVSFGSNGMITFWKKEMQE